MNLFPKSIKQWVRFSVLVLIAVSLFTYVIRSIYNLQYKLLYYPESIHASRGITAGRQS